MNAYFKTPTATNEPISSYAPGTPERAALQAELKKQRAEQIDVPMYIDGKAVYTNNKITMSPPHDHKHILGTYNYGDASHVKQAIDSCLNARKKWAKMPWEDRAAIFLRAADLISGPYRYKISASTMLAQSKNAYQSEIDAVCEFADFLRFNVQYMTDIYKGQPESSTGMWNRLQYRPLEGFTFAITPFNFTAIAGNLPMAPALMGNVCVWKPAESQIFSANMVMEIFREAGLPDGVINLIFVPGQDAGDIIFKHPEFAGLHFTGSTGVFKHLWKEIGNNIDIYNTYPKIVGETGGKDFVMVHPSAKAAQVAVGIARGAFEFQGQKCSAASRAYVPASLWPEVKSILTDIVNDFKVGPTEDFSNFINAVIDEAAFDKIAGYVDFLNNSPDADVILGGTYDKSKGYFIQPTVAVTKDPKFRTLCEEIFGPVITVFVYEDNKFKETLELVNETSNYALTGCIFCNDRYETLKAIDALENAAGNFYINDKPTGAVVGQQPFGGARGSGTNDKAGSYLNLLRWVSPRTIKETFVPPTDYKYPFLG